MNIPKEGLIVCEDYEPVEPLLVGLGPAHRFSTDWGSKEVAVPEHGKGAVRGAKRKGVHHPCDLSKKKRQLVFQFLAESKNLIHRRVAGEGERHEIGGERHHSTIGLRSHRHCQSKQETSISLVILKRDLPIAMAAAASLALSTDDPLTGVIIDPGSRKDSANTTQHPDNFHKLELETDFIQHRHVI